MGTIKKVATKAATTKKAAKPAAKSSSKAAAKKAPSKPRLETKLVCFTDQKTGKQFCGEMTEVPSEKAPKKIAGTRRRKR